ncbi:PAS domain S-box protein [Polaromonas sp. P1(28)-8]|nr:PAS domain S-box protein [Polaromonas sp. P1(28)-8]
MRLIEGRVAGGLCSILLVEGQQLHHGAAAGLPESFMRLIDGLPVGQGAGACGTAAFLKQAVIVEDIATDPLMKDFREVARTYGLQACWSTPVISGEGEVLATFAVYHRTPCKPRDKDLELLETAIRLARIALEHTRAQAALVSSEARFHELADNIQDVFYNRDARTGRMLYVSPGYERIWGLSCESLYADPKSYLGAVLPEDRPVLEMVDELTAAGKVCDLEYRIISPDGQTRWIRDNAYPVFNAAGELERVVGTARDITDRKLADRALDSTNRAMQMLSRSSVALNRIDDEASLLAEVCRVAVEVGSYRMAWVGYARDDEARSIEPMAHAGEEAGYLAMVNVSWQEDDATGQGPAGQAIRSGQPQQTGDIAAASNHFFWQEAALQRGYRSAICLPLRDDGRRGFGVLCLYAAEVQHFVAGEVSLLQELADNLAFGIVSLRARLERRRSEELVRQTAAKMREQASLLDRAQDAIMVRNLDRTLRYWNKGAERLYGWTAEEVLGKTMDEFMYRSPQVLISAMNRTLANHGEWTGELEQVARDGSTVYIEARWTVVRDEHGQVNGVLGINTDIRERKRAHEEILRLNTSLEERVQQRTAQLEFANKQLESFSYSVSHDLRTPLSAIDGFSDLLDKALAKTVSGPQADRSRHYLSRIRAGVSQMGELIDAMLSLAQVSRASLRWETVDLSALALDVLARQRDREPGRVAQLQVEPGLAAQGDPRLLQQVLENLLGNAWKFSAGTARTEITFGQQAGPGSETVYFCTRQRRGF